MERFLIDELLCEEDVFEWESDSSVKNDFFHESSSDTDSSANNHERVKNIEAVIASYSDKDFKLHFRLKRSTAQILIDRYKGFRNSDTLPHRGLPKIAPEKEIYLFLWYIANTNTFREVGHLFGVCSSTAWNIVRRISDWLISIGDSFIRWPDENEARRIATTFESKTKIPGILGCIDGSHIGIKAPKENRESYYNRKRYYSISLQGVVDCNKKFINVFCGEPGSLHDSRVLRRSSLFQKATENLAETFPNRTFLLGDSAYASLSWLIPPFKNNGSLCNLQTQFNRLHSSARVIVEHSFGLLKTRFRRLLHFTEQTHIHMVVNITICATILHNLCLDNDDEIINSDPNNQHLQETNDENRQVTVDTNRRQELMQELIRRNVLHNP